MWKELGVGLLGGVLLGTSAFAIGEVNHSKRIDELNQSHAVEIEQMQTALDESEENLNSYKLLFAQQSLELDETKAKLATTETNLANANNSLLAKDEELAQVNSELDEANSRITTLEGEKTTLQTQISNLETELETNKNLTAEQKAEYESQLSILQGQYDSKVVELNNAISERDELQEQYNTILAEKTQLQNQVSTLTEEKANLESEIVTLTNKVAELEDQLYALCIESAGCSNFNIVNGEIVEYIGPADVEEISIPSYYSVTDKGAIIDGLDYTVMSISAGAFNSCTNLKKLHLPVGVTSIGANTFANLTTLESITIEKNVETIDASAFAGCTNITFTVVEGNQNFSTYLDSLYNNDFTTLVSAKGGTFAASDINSATNRIGSYAFAGRTITELALPESIDYVDSYAFSGCTSLTSVTFNEGIIRIGECVFKGCTSLTTLEFLSSSAPTLGQTPFVDGRVPDVIYVPELSETFYMMEPVFEDYSNIIVEREDVFLPEVPLE